MHLVLLFFPFFYMVALLGYLHDIIGKVNKTSNSDGKKWKPIFDHQGWVQKLTSTKENSRNLQFWHWRSNRNYTKKHLAIEHRMTDSICRSNIICVLFGNYKITIFVFCLCSGQNLYPAMLLYMCLQLFPPELLALLTEPIHKKISFR